ncbi:MAG TPA: response regulator transcription factor [Firmicutes bacterium]|nr:response regulator transcription factor [Bacillota bacterium]
MLILVIDDDPKITSFLRRGLSYEGHEVLVANDAETGLEMAISRTPDIVILDVLMPGMDGFEVCRRIRQKSDVAILMLTAKDEVADKVKGLDYGADDYVVKPFAFDELLARIRALSRRKVDEERRGHILKFADLTLDTMAREAWRGKRRIELTTKEFELLSLFMRHPRQVLLKQNLMDEIWGVDYAGESNVLEVYIGYLRQKLEEGGEPRLIHTVRGAGYVLKE